MSEQLRKKIQTQVPTLLGFSAGSLWTERTPEIELLCHFSSCAIATWHTSTCRSHFKVKREKVNRGHFNITIEIKRIENMTIPAGLSFFLGTKGKWGNVRWGTKGRLGLTQARCFF